MRNRKLTPGLMILLGAMQICMPAASRADVLPGVEVLIRDHARELAGKRIGILTNPTGVDRNLVSTIDRVRTLAGVQVVRLFAPEHGLRGGFYAGVKVDESVDPVSGLPIASLYGSTRRPTPEMLQGLDIILYDIQDVGVRHYTFISTLTNIMEACEKAGVAVWVLDRPEPMGGNLVGGPVIEEGLLSFIGIHAAPTVYGMTPGEWAQMIKTERTPKLGLKVIPLEGWKRGMTYDQLGWMWVSPSQHIPHWETCFFYAMTGAIGENSTISVGIGTPLPFEQVGAPQLDGVKFAETLNALKLPGVQFRATTFTPRYGLFKDTACQGAQIHVRDFHKVDPERVGFELMAALVKVAPALKIFAAGEQKPGDPSMFLKALGDRQLGATLAAGQNPHTQRARLNKGLQDFLKRRQRYLIYP